MKKVVAFLTAMTLLAVILVGCGGGQATSVSNPPAESPNSTASPSPAGDAKPAESQAGTLRIGMVTPDADHGFTGESVAHAKAELEALKASGRIAEFKYEVGGEAALQIAAIETILQWGPDVIVLWPLEGEQLRNAAQTIVDKGVKLIIYDRLIDGFRCDGEIMGDNETIGEMTGNYLLNYFGGELKAGEKLTYHHPKYSLIVESRNGAKIYFQLDQLTSNKDQTSGGRTNTGVIDTFVSALISGEASYLDAEESIKAMRVIFAAEESAHKGSTIHISQ